MLRIYRYIRAFFWKSPPPVPMTDWSKDKPPEPRPEASPKMLMIDPKWRPGEQRGGRGEHRFIGLSEDQIESIRRNWLKANA